MGCDTGSAVGGEETLAVFCDTAHLLYVSPCRDSETCDTNIIMVKNATILHFQVWAAQEGRDVHVGGRANRDKSSFNDEFAAVVEAVPEKADVAV